MSSAPRALCTECHIEWRSCDVRTFSMCSKHHLCKECLGKRGARSQTAISQGKCPACDESRRRLSVQVRTSIWTDQNVQHVQLECVSCGRYRTGAVLMACEHAYCMPCLRKQPRSAQTRTVHGDMARGCHKCEKKAAEALREEARHAMSLAEDEARTGREVRETRDFREDAVMYRENLRPKKRTAPKPPQAPERPLTVPVAPSFLEKTSDGNLGIAKPVWRKITKEPQSKSSHANAAAAPVDVSNASSKNQRRVSFDPEVHQRVITPRADKRHSLPASTLLGGASASSGPTRTSRSGSSASKGSKTATSSVSAGGPLGLRLDTTPSWLHKSATSSSVKSSEPKTPRVNHRTLSRGWGIASP